jgi:hypothetical protein
LNSAAVIEGFRPVPMIGRHNEPGAKMRKIIGVIPAILLALAVTHAQDKSVAKPNDAAEKALIAKVLAVIEAQNKTAAKPNAETEKMLIANERALQDAVAKADKASYLSLVLVPEGFWATKQGFVPMKLLADGLDHFKWTKWDMLNPRVIWLDDDSAILSYVWTGTGTFFDQPLAPTTLASTVWTKRDGKWLAVSHQQSDFTPPR